MFAFDSAVNKYTFGAAVCGITKSIHAQVHLNEEAFQQWALQSYLCTVSDFGYIGNRQ